MIPPVYTKRSERAVREHLQTLESVALGQIALGLIDVRKQAAMVLAERGLDHAGKWIGFDAATKLHESTYQ
jgi:hypothetical protein